jgi:hypothetical protein
MSSSWLKSHTILFHKKGDPTRLDNCRSIILASSLYKLWTTCIVTLATNYIQSRKILSSEQEGFWADRSYARAVTHLRLCVKDAHSHKKDINPCYLVFKGAFPSTYHKQLVRVLYNYWDFPITSPALSPTYIAGHPRNSLLLTDTPHPWGSDGAPSKVTLCPLFSSTSWSNF